MNVSSQPKTLYEGTVIAKISPVSEIASPVSGKIHSKTEFPPYSDFLKSSVGSTSPTLNKIGNLSFTFPFTTISLCGGITTVSETETL
jgi:hypothetical protein